MSTRTGTQPSSVTGTGARLADRLCAYWALIKGRQTLLLLATAVTGYLSARPQSGWPLEAGLMLFSLLAAISGTTSLNMVLDRDVDARMERTADRPLPRGTLPVTKAAVFGGILVSTGLGLALWMSGVFGMVIAAGVVLDLLVYTLWLKRRSPWSIIFGGMSGGMPILAGRALVTGRVDGLGLLLALSVLTWIPAHVMTLSMKYADDYRAARIPTWPTVRGFRSARQFIAGANALCLVALVWSGWLLRICPFSLALLGLSGTVMLGLSIRSIGKPTARLNDVLFRAASVHMLGSMILITLGALL